MILGGLGAIAAALGGLWSVDAPPRLRAGVAAIYVEDLAGITVGRASAAQRTANSRIINAHLQRGTHLRLRAGAWIEIGRTLKVASGGAIVGDSSTAKAVIYMPAGAFENANDDARGGRYASNAVGIDFSGELGGSRRPSSGVSLENLRIVSEEGGGRRLRAIVGRNVAGCSIRNVEISGLPVGVGLTLASARKCRISNIHIHDFADNSSWRQLPQSTGIEIDNDTVGGLGSSDNRIDHFRIERLEMGRQLVARWGYQTDGINILSTAVRTEITDGYIASVGEGIDTFGTDGGIRNVTIVEAYNFGLKFIHGASRNVARNISIRNAGLAFVTIAGSGQARRDTANNLIMGLVGVGLDPHGDWAGSDTSGVLITDNGRSPTGRPRNNRVEGADLDPGPNGEYGWLDTSTGSGNVGTGIALKRGHSLRRCVLVQKRGGAVQVIGDDALPCNAPR